MAKRAQKSIGGGSSGPRVAVFGGGPAGLAAAHELAERGFEVDLYERLDVVGGKCRSYGVPNTGTDGRKDLPAEIGGHFVLPVYDTFMETMGRVPTPDGRTARDHFTAGGPGSVYRLLWGDARLDVPNNSLANLPDGAHGSKGVLRVLRQSYSFIRNFTIRDLMVVASKLAALLTSGPRRQWGQLEHMAFADYINADRMSPNGTKLRQAPMALGTSPGDRMNSRIVAIDLQAVLRLAIRPRAGISGRQLLFADGPANEAWVDPWAAHIRSLGGRIHTGHAVSSLAFAGGRVVGATVVDSAGMESPVEADYFVLAVPVERAVPLMSDELVAADPALGRLQLLETMWTPGVHLYLSELAPEIGIISFLFGPKRQQGADEALWLIGPINWTAQWSAGSEFAQRYGDGKAVSYVPVEIAPTTWTELPGRLWGKPMSQCTEDEIRQEIIHQIRRLIPEGERIVADSAIHSFHLSHGVRREGDEWVNDNATSFAPSPGCYENQPEVATRIPNLFLAGGYVRSLWGADNMDGAIETGKKAAAAIIADAGVAARPVQLPTWPPPTLLRPLHAIDNVLYRLGLPNMFDIVSPAKPAKKPANGSANASPGEAVETGRVTQTLH